MRSQMSVGMKEMTILDATVPWSLISRIKRECSGECTTFDAVAVLFWQCHTRAVVISDPDTPAPLFFPSIMRWLLGAAKHGYYGNCVMRQLVQAKSGTVASGDVKDFVKLIRLAKRKKIPGMLTITNGGGGGGGSGTETPPPRYNTLVVTSLRNLGLDLDVVDLGRGSPARVMPPACKTKRTASNFCVLCPPCKGKDNVNVVSICVKPEHADAFARELAALGIC
ncbi:hypothetical protein ZWY2020_046325 [Hordeum vulgare]|nr:hypothetical protein ZWY2020_046325 [Hordeum vulgare]